MLQTISASSMDRTSLVLFIVKPMGLILDLEADYFTFLVHFRYVP
jgi:hypothetical protein